MMAEQRPTLNYGDVEGVEDAAAALEKYADYEQMMGTNLAQLRKYEQPDPDRHPFDWMIWMVHRVYLNDPTLKELNFSGMQMPRPQDCLVIAPKL